MENTVVAVFKNGQRIRYKISMLLDLLSNTDVDYVYDESTNTIF